MSKVEAKDRSKDRAIEQMIDIVKTKMNSEYDRLPDINNLDDLREYENDTIRRED